MTNAQHSQHLFDVELHGADELGRALRNLPTGGTLKLAGSAVALTRVAGGRRFALSVPPKITEPITVDPRNFKSATTAVDELLDVHKQAMEQLERRGVQ